MTAEPAVLRRALDAVNRRDADSFVECCSPDVVIEPLLGAVEGVYRGHEGARRWLADRDEQWLEITIEFGQFRPAGPEGAWMGRGRVSASGRRSRIDVAQDVTSVTRLDSGLISWIGIYGSSEEARERLE